MKTKIIVILLALTFIQNVNAERLKLPKQSVTKQDIITQILNDSSWEYDNQTKELKLCFYLNDINGVCTSVPKQYIIIPVIDKPSI